MKFYELTGDFADMYDRFEEIDNWEPDTNEDGKPVDNNGNIIEDVDAYKETMYQAWFDTLEGIEGLFEDKAVNIAVCIKHLRSDANQLKAEKLQLNKRQTSKTKAADRLEKYLLNGMQVIGRTEIDRPQALIRIKQNPESIVVDNEVKFIEWAEANNHDELLNYQQPTIRKEKVKAFIKRENEQNMTDDKKIKFVHLERKTVVKIK